MLIHWIVVFFDEVFQSDGDVRKIYRTVYNIIQSLDQEEFIALMERCKKCLFLTRESPLPFIAIKKMPLEKIFPFDLFPRIISAQEWDHIERGVMQRTTAINTFLQDLYG